MRLSDFDTLALAQSHIVTTTKMISPDMMVAFMATFGVLRAVLAEDTEAAEALRVSLQFGSEFNLIQDHSANVISLLNEIDAATSDFKSHCIAYANQETKPFISATQAEFDIDKLRQPTTEVDVTYATNDYATKTRGRDIKLDVMFTEPVPFDVRIDLLVLVKNPQGVFVESSSPITVPVFIKLGELGRYALMSREFSNVQELQFKAVCSHNLTFSLAVLEA
jgi:hypothetical protein